jgi:hypothetical protein
MSQLHSNSNNNSFVVQELVQAAKTEKTCRIGHLQKSVEAKRSIASTLCG